MKFTLTLCLTMLCSTFIFGQFTSPDTGVKWNLDSIAAHSPTTVIVTDTTYMLMENFTLEINDSLLLDTDLILEIASGVEVRIKGYFESNAGNVVITAVDTMNPYKGFWFENMATAVFKNTLIQYGGGLRVVTPNFVMDSCEMSYNASGSSTGGAITFSSGSPIVKNSVFKFNFNPALSSGANVSCPAIIESNYFEGNNQRNNNRPQINMGPSGENDTIKIMNNTVIGDRSLTLVGGISASSLVGVVNNIAISGNIVRDNRYAITTLGTFTTGYISYNVLEDNDTETNPNNGGSGISLYNTGLVVCTGNAIRRNLWGVTIIGTAMANLGSNDDEDYNPGGNIFSENMNGGTTYALFNNTPNTIKAQNNCWIEGAESTLEQAGVVIYDVADIAALGEVIYDPIDCALISADVQLGKNNVLLYPNPAQNSFFIETASEVNLRIYDLGGKLLFSENKITGTRAINTDLPQGFYFAELIQEGNKTVQKLIIE